MVSQSTNTNRDSDNWQSISDLVAAYIAENGAPRVYQTGMRWRTDRMPASYDPKSTYNSVDKCNPHVCARWSDN